MARKKNPALCVVKFCRKRRERNRTKCSRHRKREWRKRNPLQARLSNCKDRARKKGIEFNLTLKDFEELEIKLGMPITTRHHIDRISVAKGYTKDNIQILLDADNIAKGNRERGNQLQIL